MGTALMALGSIMGLVGGIWIIVLAFREHFFWGLACLLLWPVQLFFTIFAWRLTWKPLLLQITGWMILFAGSVIAG